MPGSPISSSSRSSSAKRPFSSDEDKDASNYKRLRVESSGPSAAPMIRERRRLPAPSPGPNYVPRSFTYTPEYVQKVHVAIEQATKYVPKYRSRLCEVTPSSSNKTFFRWVKLIRKRRWQPRNQEGRIDPVRDEECVRYAKLHSVSSTLFRNTDTDASRL